MPRSFGSVSNILSLALLTLIVFLVIAVSPANAAAAQAATGIGINFAPLIPVVNGFIEAAAGLLSAATPVILGYVIIWLRNHGIAMKEQAQKTISERIQSTIENGFKFATTGADNAIQNLKVQTPNPLVAAAANYAIAQSPDLLKRAGIDVTTEAGQQMLVRRVIASQVQN